MLFRSGSELTSPWLQAEFTYKVKPKPAAQFAVVDKDNIPFAVIVAPDELAKGLVRIKPQVGKEEAKNDGEVVERTDMVLWLTKKLAERL